eukprot:CAMPEP_0206020856 /NCGR_PEP_ID=MMETSP1464-20131121/31817_1 /ASSEMBLY_ACC=CAM_ASM_001124 /TAXON_ID=119497 /ORGANISM="Exanthemachrysis gayraliae, Strain RCC1523" /LENGTH=68 /DNA_ID=CAMNT_0053394795 /DNA_START=497 /DNA_END=700 /DNA_ORIENTATION=-
MPAIHDSARGHAHDAARVPTWAAPVPPEASGGAGLSAGAMPAGVSALPPTPPVPAARPRGGEALLHED